MIKYATIALALALIGSLGANWRQANKIGDIQHAFDDYKVRQAVQLSDWQAKARAYEHSAQVQATKASDEYQRGLSDGQATVDDLEQQLADGRLRLHREQASVATAQLSSEASAKRADANKARAELSESRVLDLVRLLKEGDDRTRQANALIDAWDAQ